MSVYKSLTTSDVIVTPFKVNKSFTFEGSGSNSFNLPNVSIDRYFGKNLSSTPWISGSNSTGQIYTLNEELVYNSIKQLYYSNYLSGSNGSPAVLPQFNVDGTITSTSGSYQPMYDNYLPDTLLANRLFPTALNDRIGVISIPSDLFGEYIKPGTFELTYTGSFTSGTITDDENGNLLSNNSKVGDIIYQHGMVILTSFGTSITGSKYGPGLNLGYGFSQYSTNGAEELNEIITSDDIQIDFQSTMTIYESQYKCTYNPNEFVYSQNPSIISGSCDNKEGKLYDFATGSYFEPYITTVGLYNNSNQLVAVGKLSQPLQSSNVTDTTVLVNLDL
jgi:hypothetical protein